MQSNTQQFGCDPAGAFAPEAAAEPRLLPLVVHLLAALVFALGVALVCGAWA